MESVMRQTGIDVIGEVPWGTHFCQFYETSQDLIEILVPYFKEGLASKEFCMWVTSEPLQVDQAMAALRAAVPNLDEYINSGQIEILDYSQWYTRSGKFSADEVLQGWVDKLKAAQERGYEGLRLTGNTFWLEKADWDDFTRYEETVNNVIGQYPMLAICTYSLQKCNAIELLDVVANHQFTLIKRSGIWKVVESAKHKKIEQALRESEEKLSTLYASMVEGVALHEIVYDDTGRPVDYVILDVNPSFEKFTGLSRTDALGQRASVLYCTGEAPYLDVYARVASSGETESFETYFEPMKKHFSISVFSPSHGKFATVFSDITEHKWMDERLQEKQEELEVQAEELEVQNEELHANNIELSEATRKLQESEEKYRELVENANSIIIKMDNTGKITFFNDYAQKFFGYSSEEVIGKNVNIIVPPIESNGRNLEEMVDSILKNPDEFVENINENICKNGDRVWISWRNKAIRNAQGDIIGNLAVGQDITERKRTEATIAQLASFPELNPSPIVEVDLTGQVLYANPAARRLFPDLQERGIDHQWLSEFNLIVRVLESCRQSYYVRDVTADERIYQQTAYYVRERQSIRIYGIDVTERRQAEEVLRRSEARWNAAIESFAEGAIIATMDEQVIYWNPAAREMHGFTRPDEFIEPLEKTPITFQLWTPDGSHMLELDEWPMRRIKRGETVRNLELRIRRPDQGWEKIFSYSGAMVDTASGERLIFLTCRDLTELRRAERALHESESRFRLALKNAPVSVAAQDSDLCFIWAYNQRSALPDQIIGHFDRDIFTAEEAAHFTAMKRRVLEEGVEQREQMWLDRPTGRMYLDIYLEPIRDKVGRIIGVASATMDLTKIKLAEEELKESEGRLRLALDAARMTAWEYDPATLKVTFSENVESVLELPLRHENSDQGYSFIHPDDVEHHRELITEAIATGGNYVSVYRHAHGERVIWLEEHGQSVIDRAGKTARLVGVVQNITARKQAEERLRRQQAEIQTLLENTPAGLVLFEATPPYKVLAHNRYYQELFAESFRSKGMVGLNVYEYAPAVEAEGVVAVFDEVVRTKQPKSFLDFPYKSDPPRQSWFNWHISPLILDGQVVALVSMSLDVTDRHRADEALQKANKELAAVNEELAASNEELRSTTEEIQRARRELELRVRERTSELQDAKENLEVINEELQVEISEHENMEKDLLKAKEEAEESVKSKSAFLANMSHELRTPMNAVIGFSSLLLDDKFTQEQKEYIEGIRKGGEALLDLINEILDFSKAEKDKIELERQPFSLKHLIDESLDLVATQASKKGLNLSETINYGTSDTIIGDHGRLRQILVNLLSNAVKFTDKGDISVSISSKAVEDDMHQIFFEVKDTGIGIPQDKMNEIFEPFTQVERTLSRKRDGVGLGLAITRQLVELMGGEIWAESEEGQGTTFHFMIRAETIPGKQLYFGKINSGIATVRFPELKPMRILVAEDNPSNQRVLVDMLKRLGYRADAVSDGREVVQAFERQDYDLVLMDIKMPEMDGITATQVIRKLRPENGPKIVAITAFALKGDREKCLAAGMDDYIAKPVQIRELAEVLKKCSPEIP